MTATSSSSPLRIAFLVKMLPATAWISDQVLGLLERRHEVRVLAQARDDDDLEQAADPAERGYAERVRLIGVRRGGWSRTLALGGDLLRATTRDPTALRALARGGGGGDHLRTALAASDCDLVHAHFGNHGAALLPVGRRLGRPFLVSFYGWDIGVAPRRTPGLYGPLFREAAAVIALSEEMRRSLLGLGCPARLLHVVRVAVRGERLRRRAEEVRRRAGPRRADAPIRVLGVGRLVEKKGFDDALAALALLARDGTGFEFRLAGDGPLRAELEAQVARLGLGPRTRFLGKIDREAVFDEMALADILLQPSRTAADGDAEGTPTVLMEAGALSLPSVATRHAGTAEVVIDEETGLLVAERDVRGLADRLARLVARPDDRARLGAAARRRIDAEFDLDGQCARLEEIYRGCLAAA